MPTTLFAQTINIYAMKMSKDFFLFQGAKISFLENRVINLNSPKLAFCPFREELNSS